MVAYQTDTTYFSTLDGSAGLLGVGNYIATSPAPENVKVPLETVAYVAGMVGFAIKEALRGQVPPAPETKA